jgi:phosphoenolpyruvate-protein kinase (PTS system EI component)
LNLTGKIVLIENADPGFDWIFAQQIGGLITKYGGANSHMAIRCAEFGIPAAIGCGEQRFEMFTRAHQLLLDCAAGLINPLH